MSVRLVGAPIARPAHLPAGVVVVVAVWLFVASDRRYRHAEGRVRVVPALHLLLLALGRTYRRQRAVHINEEPDWVAKITVCMPQSPTAGVASASARSHQFQVHRRLQRPKTNPAQIRNARAMELRGNAACGEFHLRRLTAGTRPHLFPKGRQAGRPPHAPRPRL